MDPHRKWKGHFCHSHFKDEEIERSSDLTKSTKLEVDGAGMQVQEDTLQILAPHLLQELVPRQ